MIEWLHVALIVVSAGFLALILFLVIRRWIRRRSNPAASDAERGQNLQSGIARLHQVSPHHHQFDGEASKKSSYGLLRRGGGGSSAAKPAFSWADHPSLVTDAVENGWSRFAFAAPPVQPSPSVKSLLASCAAATGSGAEIGWEVCEGSADFMQRVRLNPGTKKGGGAASSSVAAAAVMRAALPLPGPNLGNLSFPQEAYFEVTVAAATGDESVNRERRGTAEGDKMKLIDEDFNAKSSRDSVNHSHSQRRSKVEEVKIGRNEGIWLSVGLTGVNPLPLRIPGSFAASIGFNSNGSLYLDGSILSLPLSLE